MIPTLYRLMLRTQVSRSRIVGMAALGVVAVVVGIAVGASGPRNPLDAAAGFVNLYGLTLLVPVATLVFASASLGDLSEDGTLVYLWLRPVPRWQIVVAAVLASFTVTWPLVVIPLSIGAALAGGGTDLVLGTVAASTTAMIAYSALFVALGLRVKRALTWGLVYIFVWEGFVARANTSAARLAIRSYSASLLSDATGVEIRLADFTVASSWLVPLSVGFVAVLYASWRLARQDIT
jgi:ABC-2 type transport system permease protein